MKPEFPVHEQPDGTYWFTPGEYFEWLCKENEKKNEDLTLKWCRF